MRSSRRPIKCKKNNWRNKRKVEANDDYDDDDEDDMNHRVLRCVASHCIAVLRRVPLFPEKQRTTNDKQHPQQNHVL